MLNSLFRGLAIALGSSLIAAATAGAAGRTRLASLEIAAPCTGTSKPENLFTIIRDAAPLQSGQYTPEQLAGIFPAFQHKPFDQAGFNAVMLPFTCSDPSHRVNINEAEALAALISNDLDWSPGCYCSMHALFVFQRDHEFVQRFMHGYAPADVANLIKRWDATNAVGGELIHTAKGYTGKLEIFNAKGGLILSRTYSTPESYWNLLGDMDVAAMTALDVKPSKALAEYLHEPRCKDFQSVVELGSAAFADGPTQAFTIYGKILQTDPGFAMVRHWYANQKHWADGDNQDWANENGLALSSRIVPASLEEFNTKYCTDAKLAAQLPDWLDEAEKLVPDSPTIIECRLRNHCFGAQTHSQLMARGLKVAAKYPNWRDLLDNLGWNTPDRYLGASLLTAAVLDRYTQGTSVNYAEYDLAWVCNQIGRDDIAMELLSAGGPDQPKFHLDFLEQVLCSSGRYAQAVGFYPLLNAKPSDGPVNTTMSPYAAFAAFLSGKPELFNQIRTEENQAFASLGLVQVFQYYADNLAGKPAYVGSNGGKLDPAAYWEQILRAADDAGHGISRDHFAVSEMLCNWPIDRLLWIVEDDYEKRDPSADAGAFYCFLKMFYSYDPWVNKAVVGYYKRGGMEMPIDPQMLIDDLQTDLNGKFYQLDFGKIDWKYVPTPWRVATCVHQLLQEKQIQKARAVAQLYDEYEAHVQAPQQLTIAAELLRRTDEALH